MLISKFGQAMQGIDHGGLIENWSYLKFKTTFQKEKKKKSQKLKQCNIVAYYDADSKRLGTSDWHQRRNRQSQLFLIGGRGNGFQILDRGSKPEPRDQHQVGFMTSN